MDRSARGYLPFEPPTVGTSRWSEPAPFLIRLHAFHNTKAGGAAARPVDRFRWVSNRTTLSVVALLPS
jgi:hypothetical protein